MPEIGSTTREEVDMKQLLQALPSDVTLAPPAGRVPSSTYACATVLPVHPAAFDLTTQGTSGRTRTHGANRLMVIPTNAHRRPPETPT
jgi:hypothetical protein